MILNNSASSCGRLICNRVTFPLSTIENMKMGKKRLFEGIRVAPRHLGPEGVKFQRSGTHWFELGICQLKQFFPAGHLIIQISRIVIKKKRKPAIWVLSVNAGISQKCLISAECIFLSVNEKGITNLSK